jgi:hypothetical protein
VYRSMKPTPGEDLPDVGALATIDSFLSTSPSLGLAEIYAEESSIIYEIQTGAREETDFLYANLAYLDTDSPSSSVSVDQQEVLFQLYTSFRVNRIQRDIKPTRVVLHLLGREELDQMSNEMEGEFQNTCCAREKLLAPGEVWKQRGDIANAVEYYQKLFTILLSNENERMETIMVRLEALYTNEEERSMK